MVKVNMLLLQFEHAPFDSSRGVASLCHLSCLECFCAVWEKVCTYAFQYGSHLSHIDTEYSGYGWGDRKMEFYIYFVLSHFN